MSSADAGSGKKRATTLVYRQTFATRLTHWVWAISLFFLVLTGLQIFNAHPSLYIGKQSGFGFDNSILAIGAERKGGGIAGYTELFGARFDTTGVLGVSGSEIRPEVRAFPGWATIPSNRDLATGRVIHLFFAWILVGTLVVWLVASVLSGHLRRDVWPRLADLKAIPREIGEHVRLRFGHSGRYNALQKLSYAIVMFVLLPMMVVTGLAMSPGVNAMVPFLNDILGGRQTARTIHFAIMVLLIGFFIIHIVMIFAAGPINELRSIITGWFRATPAAEEREGDSA